MTQIPNALEGFWTCHWHAIYGNSNPADAYRPDSEKKIIDADGDPICKQCAKTYWRERARAELEDKRAKG